MKMFLTIITLSITFSSFAKGVSSKSTLIKCAQDIVDYGMGEKEGLIFSARILQDLDDNRASVGTLLKECIDFKAMQSKQSPNRDNQLEELHNLRDSLSPNVYFFLRGVIRPLITCEPFGVLTKCESATGKRWVETVIFDQRATENHYRLGHSTQGPMVRGIISLTAEDQEYLESLPDELKTVSEEALIKNEGSRYLRFKVMKLRGSLKFIRHYFQN